MRLSLLLTLLLLGVPATAEGQPASTPTTAPASLPASAPASLPASAPASLPASAPTSQPTEPPTVWLPASQPASAPATRPAAIEFGDGDGPPRLSLPTEEDLVAWTKPGFRIGLGLTYGVLAGLDGAPGGGLLGPFLRFGFRLDERWSLLSSFQYSAATSDDGGVSGLRFAGTIEPVVHFGPGLSLATGLGFGGLVEGRTGRPDAPPYAGEIEVSYTFPDASTPISSCSGVGVAGLVRLDWTGVLGARSATGFSLELDGQWTACVSETGRVEPDTAEPLVRRQWWPHVGATLSWVILWR